MGQTPQRTDPSQRRWPPFPEEGQPIVFIQVLCFHPIVCRLPYRPFRFRIY